MSAWKRLFKYTTTPKLQRKSALSGVASRAYMVSPGQAVWMERDYARFAQEAYIRNVVAHRAINLVADGAASIKLKSTARKKDAALALLANPNPLQSQGEFLRSMYQYRLISGNAFVLGVGAEGFKELHLLRPDRMAVIAGKNGLPAGNRYSVNNQATDYPVDRLSGLSRVLHLKQFHPLSDWYGLSPVEAAAYSIDQHNQSGAWNQALMQNGARPSGALVVKPSGIGEGTLSEAQYSRLKTQIDEQFSGAANAGRPMLLEGGLDWKEMSLTPKDMDFIDAKHSAARDIALAFGVPPQLLGIPGDNTYANLQEARLALWEQTILPLAETTMTQFGQWLFAHAGASGALTLDVDSIPALATRNQAIWDRVEKASFLTDDEKRAAVGYGAKN
jgi:HK97 family phage portal protein